MNPVSKKIKPNGNSNSNQQQQESGKQQSVEESITAQLKNRMLVSGEWLR
jgi:hypothetical protein